MREATTRQEVERNNAVVSAIIRAGGSEADCIVALHNRNMKLVDKLIKADLIAPFKIEVDGKVMIWRCPEELVPSRDVPTEGVTRI